MGWKEFMLLSYVNTPNRDKSDIVDKLTVIGLFAVVKKYLNSNDSILIY